MRRVIVLTKRSDDWHAAIKGDPGKWGCGRTIPQAIGDLITSHLEDFGIEIEQ